MSSILYRVFLPENYLPAETAGLILHLLRSLRLCGASKFLFVTGKFTETYYEFIAGSNAMTIRVFITGGTFDKEYNELTGELFFKDTHLPEMLQRGRCNLDLEIRTLMMIDSLLMTDEDRQIILDNCIHCTHRQIVITHGTDTMEQTARVLGNTIRDKTIVLTGAMIPYKFGSSDGLFNLGSALAFVQVLPPGIYIAMNGRCFTWDNVHKNAKIGQFEEINPT
jgi:L-asparaginase